MHVNVIAEFHVNILNLLCLHVFQSLRSISWHHEGKQFMSSHSDGSLVTWNVKAVGKPASIITPHGKSGINFDSVLSSISPSNRKALFCWVVSVGRAQKCKFVGQGFGVSEVKNFPCDN